MLLPLEGQKMNERLGQVKRGFGGSFREFGILIAFVIVVTILMIISPDAFANPKNLVGIVRQASINGILACGMMFVILSNGIDLSVGSIVALSGVMAAHFAHPESYPLAVPIIIAILVGLSVGVVNGIGVAYGGIPPFIITLATMTAVRGIALIASGGSPVFGLSDDFKKLASGTIGNTIIPVLAIYFIVIICICGFVLSKTVFGRRVYAIGGNEIAAKVSGISVKKMRLAVYSISGALAGLAGVLLASRTYQGSPTAGVSYELDAIAAVIIGGVSMSGGAGKWYGTLIGALLLAVIANGLDILNVSSNYQMIIKGAIIAIAVLVDIKGKSAKD